MENCLVFICKLAFQFVKKKIPFMLNGFLDPIKTCQHFSFILVYVLEDFFVSLAQINTQVLESTHQILILFLNFSNKIIKFFIGCPHYLKPKRKRIQATFASFFGVHKYRVVIKLDKREIQDYNFYKFVPPLYVTQGPIQSLKNSTIPLGQRPSLSVFNSFSFYIQQIASLYPSSKLHASSFFFITVDNLIEISNNYPRYKYFIRRTSKVLKVLFLQCIFGIDVNNSAKP